MKLVVDVQVFDLERAVRFYTKVLGLFCRVQEKEWAAVLVGDAELHLYLGGGVTAGIEFQVDDLDAEVERLKGHGVEILPGSSKASAEGVDANNITRFPWGRAAFFKDSEGNELALIKDL